MVKEGGKIKTLKDLNQTKNSRVTMPRQGVRDWGEDERGSVFRSKKNKNDPEGPQEGGGRGWGETETPLRLAMGEASEQGSGGG